MNIPATAAYWIQLLCRYIRYGP